MAREKDECRKAYESQYDEKERSDEHYYIWQSAWNCALRTVTNNTFKLQTAI